MKHPVFLILPLVLLAGSCSIREQEAFFTSDQDSPVFYASIESPAELSTRAFVDAQMRVLWNADDRISIFNKYTFNQEYRFEGQTGDNAGSFERVPSDKFVTGNALDCIYAIYPYAAAPDHGEGVEEIAAAHILQFLDIVLFEIKQAGVVVLGSEIPLCDTRPTFSEQSEKLNAFRVAPVILKA